MSTGQYGVTSVFGGSSGVGPFLVPGGLNSGSTVNVYVVGPVVPGTPTGSISLPNVTLPAPAPTTQSTFSLGVVAANGYPVSAVQVGVDATLAWSADPGQRATMATAFKVFRAQLEALEAAKSPALLPGASELIANRLAAALPLRFDEILTYYYGFDAVGQTIDLVPGMSLRIDWAGYQYCDGPGGTGFGLNGFTATGTSHLEIVRRPDGTLAFDGFSAQFAQGVSLQPPAGCPLLAGGPIDLQLLGNGRRHLRLLWPASFSGAGSVDNAGTTNQLSCTLLGASTFADIEAATAATLAGQSACGTQSSGDDPIVSSSFTGRVTLVPELWIWVGGMPQRVPVGTTVRNVAQRFADPIPLQMQAGGGSPTNFKLTVQRWTQANAQPITASIPGFDLSLIDLSKGSAAVGPLGDGFDTPLVKGDNFWTNVAKAPS